MNISNPKTLDDAKAQEMVEHRLASAREFSKAYKDRFFQYFAAYHAYMNPNYPYNSMYNPRTVYNAVERNVERVMRTLFAKDEYFDVKAMSRQPGLAEEVQYVITDYSLSRYTNFKRTALDACKAMVMYGNGIFCVDTCRKSEKYWSESAQRFEGVMGAMVEADFEWAKIHSVSVFDAYPAPLAAEIDDMPYFIEREIPVGGIGELARSGKYDLEALKRAKDAGHCAATWDRMNDGDKDDYDIVNRLDLTGMLVNDSSLNDDGAEWSMNYCKVYHYYDRNRVISVIGDIVVRNEKNPLGALPYASIKYSPQEQNFWAVGLIEIEFDNAQQIRDRTNQINDWVDLNSKPMKLVGDSAGIEDLSLLDPYAGRVVRVQNAEGVKNLEVAPVPAHLFQSLQMYQEQSSRNTQVTDQSVGLNSTASADASKTAKGLEILRAQQNEAAAWLYLLAEATGFQKVLEKHAKLQNMILTPDQLKFVVESDRELPAQINDYAGLLMALQGEWRFEFVGINFARSYAQQLQALQGLYQICMSNPEFTKRMKLEGWLDRFTEVAQIRRPDELFYTPEEMAMAQQLANDAMAEQQQALALQDQAAAMAQQRQGAAQGQERAALMMEGMNRGIPPEQTERAFQIVNGGKL